MLRELLLLTSISSVGLLSSGGTESIILAVLAYREEGRRRGIAEPEIICGLSAHPALTKACQYLGVTQVKTMHSKWADAAGQCLNFDRLQQPHCDLRDEPFCRHLVRLFSQLSAMATMRLHIGPSTR